MNERIDKIISNQTGLSRKEVRELIREKKVKVNGLIVEKINQKVNSENDTIEINNQEVIVQKNIYLLLNKPKGYVSATNDSKDKTVLDLVDEKYRHRNLFPAGRLDKDTTGFLLITDDGDFAHEILSPKKHVKKVYEVTIDKEITTYMQEKFREGIKLKEGICKAADLKKITERVGIVTLTEGKYHQIKRMFNTFGANVLELKRLQMGELTLPKDLKEGNIKELTKEELSKIR